MPKACDLPVLTKPFAIEEDRRKTRSAKALVELIANPNGSQLDPRDRRRFLTLAIWRLTEFSTSPTSKYGIRYRSEESVKAARNPRSQIAVFHEHVVPRVWLVDQLVAKPEKAREISGLAIACVVTEKEHKKLEALDADAQLFGWERYEQAGVGVLDAKNSSFPDMASQINLKSESKDLRKKAKRICGAAALSETPDG